MRTPLATLTLTALLSLAGMASADVYKCPTQGGKAVYQDAPCAATDEPAIISPGPGSQYRGTTVPLRPPLPTALPEPPPEPMSITNCLEIDALTTKVVSRSRWYDDVAWKIEISNRCDEPFATKVRIQFLDSQGFEVEYTLARAYIPGNDTNGATGSTMLSKAQSSRFHRAYATVTRY